MSVLKEPKRVLSILLSLCLLFVCFCGCEVGTEAYNVNHNLNQSANNFECLRRITVYNARTDLIILQIEGYMALSNNSAEELVVTCKTGENEYKKAYVFLNDYILYVCEDIAVTTTDPYHYKVHFYASIPDVEINK